MLDLYFSTLYILCHNIINVLSRYMKYMRIICAKTCLQRSENLCCKWGDLF